MGDISKHFNRNEFECSCGCGQDTVDAELITVLEDVREHFGKPVKINSGNRCARHNAAIGGVAKSQHVKSRAADIVISGVDAADVYAYLDDKYTGKLGLGKYKTFTHVDTRNLMARWNKS